MIGSSHVGSGADCQDSCLALVETAPAGEPLLVVFVADGAGSALHGGDGAELAVATAADFISGQLAEPGFALGPDLAAACVRHVREQIEALAEVRGLVPRDFAATFLGVLASAAGTLAMQIGDGGIVLDFGQGLELPIVPMAGEYANMTYFITDPDAPEMLATHFRPVTACKVAVFSDGLQRLALNLSSNTPHEPFFTPFFSRLTNLGDDQEEQFQSGLVNFLGSATINERTDDDKTLALAVLLE